MNIIVKLYRSLFSASVRGKIYDHGLRRIVNLSKDKVERKAMRIWLLSPFLPRTTENCLYAFMGRHGRMYWPDRHNLPYRKLVADCRWDEQHHMHYVMHQGRRLYFPASYSWRTCIIQYRALLSEQDIHCPHRYVVDYHRLEGKTLLDIGCAEAMFTLDVIEYVRHVYLFECDELWLAALSATFEPWKEKVTVIRKFVGDKDDEQHITIDTFLKDRDTHSLFLKMDIEGAELAALHGAEQTFRQSPDIDFSICTYHKPNDDIDIPELIKSYQPAVQLEQTEGYVYFQGAFRRAIVHRA